MQCFSRSAFTSGGRSIGAALLLWHCFSKTVQAALRCVSTTLYTAFDSSDYAAVQQKKRHVAIFQDAPFAFWPQQVLYIVNVHLEGSPYRPNDRVSQMRSALECMQKHQKENGLQPERCNVVICGDFNSGAKDAVCQYLLRGRLEGGYTEAYLPQASRFFESNMLLIFNLES